MKVILVNGSPHKEGCTYTGLKEIEKTLNAEGIETEIFWIGPHPLPGCYGCAKCIDTERCIIDDKVNGFIAKAETADGFIFGSPVHFASASGAITSFMDRAFYGKGRIFRFKPTAAIVSCRRGGATATFDQLNKYFTISSMPIVSSKYWNMIHGNKPEEVLQDEEGMQTMRELGRNMAWLLKCIEAGKASGLTVPVPETPVKTNFIR
ncbi:MAG: flavodoxin family protein [Bacteroidales bacterium]|nr:flavodoxin family protein [Bacteroides sp.]MCM1502021.1 flavodoxin family protein [Bacteroidales bacterium]